MPTKRKRAAHRDKGVGTFILDRRVRGVGRIKRASGTTDPKTFTRLSGMLESLVAKGRLDLLRALRDGVVTPLELWDAYRRDDLDRLPTADTVKPLWTADDTGAVDAWLAAWKQSADHKRATASTFRQLRALAGENNADPLGIRVGDLPELLVRYRARCLTAGYVRTFNLARNHVRAFLKAQSGPTSAVYRAAADVAPLPKPKGKPKAGTRAAVAQRGGLTVAQFDAMCAALEQHDAALAAIARGMAMTGMGPKEFWGDWALHPEGREGGPAAAHVHVGGTKRAARVRDVPLIDPDADALTPPERHPRTFLDNLAEKTGVRPYQLRKTFSHWMEEARIPRTRRKLYLGHAAGDVTDVYERHELDGYLAADAQTLRDYLERQRTAR